MIKTIRCPKKNLGIFMSLLVSAVFFFSLLGFAFVEEMPRPSGEISIRISLAECELLLFSDGQVVRRYPVAIGKPDTPTPIGEWNIVWKDHAWGSGFGTRWMGLNVPWGTYGIHGTNKPWSIGTPASHGCIRMQNADAEELFDWAAVGTPVKIEGDITVEAKELAYPACGQEVVALQLRLRELGYGHGRADGMYGETLREDVKAFQQDHRLAETGVADRTLLKRLGLIE